MNAQPPVREGPPPEEPPGRRSATTWLWLVVAVLVAVIILLTVLYLSGGEELAEDGAGLTVDDIVENPDRFLDDTVSLSGLVTDVFSDRAFTITAAEFDSDAELLVVTRNPVNIGPGGFPVLGEGTIVDLTGTVRMFELVAIEDEIGADLDDILLAYEDEPVLVAERVFSSAEAGEQPATTTTSVAATTTSGQTTTTSVSTTTTAAPGTTTTAGGAVMRDVTLEELAANPEAYYGTEVRVVGDVAAILDPLAFSLVPEGAAGDLPIDQQVLVVTIAEATEELTVGGTVRVTGIAQEFDQDFRASMEGILSQPLIGDWDGRPAVLVTRARNIETF